MSEPGTWNDRFTLSPRPGPMDPADTEELGLSGLVPHPRPFAGDLTVDEAHLSRGVAHVSNVEFVAWLDRAAELHGDAAGWTRQAMLDAGVMWFVVRHEIDYLAEAHPGDRLLLLTWVRTMHRFKSWRDSVVVRPADRTVVCRASTLWVLVDLPSRRPTRVSEQMTGDFDPLERATTRAAAFRES